MSNERTDKLVPPGLKAAGVLEIRKALEEAIDLVKTKPSPVRAILVGGGSIIVGDEITGVGELIRPRYLEVANAVGAAVGHLDVPGVPQDSDTAAVDW